MRAGQLRQRIDIEYPTESRDDYGDAVLVWSNFATRWGRIEPLTGGEFWQAEAIKAGITHRVTLRHCQNVTPRMRIVYGSRTFEIIAVRHLEERTITTIIDAKEKQ